MALSIKSKNDGTIRFYHEGDGLLAVFPVTHNDERTGRVMAVSLNNGFLWYVDAEPDYVSTLKGASIADRRDAMFMVDFINDTAI